MTMRFRNYGGIHQFSVTSDEDLACIDQLDPARWAATSAPLSDLQCDKAFLEYLDPEGTGRVRVSQLVSARDFLFARLARRVRVTERTETLALDDLDAQAEAGRALRSAAERVLRELGAADPKAIALGDLRTFRESYQKRLENGDGVVPPDVIPEPAAAQLVRDVVATVGGAKDGSGADGAGRPDLDRFLERGRAWLAWRGRAGEVAPQLPDPGGAQLVAALGPEDAAAAAEAVTALDAKIEEYFWHCDLLRQEGRTADQLRLQEDALRVLSSKDAQSIEAYLAGSPLATPVPDGTLALGEPVNPVYRDAFEALRVRVLSRATSPAAKVLTRDGWRQARAHFAPYLAWQKEKPAEPFEALGEARVREIVGATADAESPLVQRLRHFIAVDESAAGELAQLRDLEKLILLQRWLVDLVNNFVNFSAVYRPDEQALIEAGSMVIDGRRLEFCVKVANRAAHKPVAAQSLLFLVYAQILEKDSGTPAYEVVTPITAGERGRMRVGKRGLFIDIAGREWDAVVVDLVENPISVKEAAFAPFRKARDFVGKKIEDWVGTQQAAQEKSMIEGVDKNVTAAQKSTEQAAKDAVEAKPAPGAPGGAAAKKEGEGLNVNTLILGGGMALAGLGAVMAGLFGMLSSLKGWLAIAGIAGAVLGVSALLGWLKLRRRDMSLVLEASGWAVNVHMTVNRQIGRVFTRTPELPEGAVIDRIDALATDEDRSGPWGYVVGALLGLAVVGGLLAFLFFRARG